jgi:hypothetical protein
MIMSFFPSNVPLMELGGMINISDRTRVWHSCPTRDRPQQRSSDTNPLGLSKKVSRPLMKRSPLELRDRLK